MQNLKTENLPVNWFDVLLVGLLIIGLFRGRKHGMTGELLLLSKWVILVVVCGLFYPVVAQLIADNARVSKTASSIYGYLALGFVIVVVFIILKKLLAHGMEGKSYFGGAEYYLGMIAGTVRFFCMLLAGLALLNGPYYSPAEVEAKEAYAKRWYGGGIYSGNYFPDLNTIQGQVFKHSFTGPYLKEYLGMFLIETAQGSSAKPDQKPAKVNIQK